MRSLERRVEMATKSSRGEPTDTEGIGAAALAWEMALSAQSCAYLAEEAQIWAQKSVDRTLALPESTYRQLLDSLGTFRLLLDTMHRRLRELNEKEENNAISVWNGDLDEEIRFMLGHGLAIITVECMTSTEKAETSSTADAGDTK
jgi:hypothetical protein